MNEKKKRTIQTLEWFIPDLPKESFLLGNSLNLIGLLGIEESIEGSTAEEAFFLKSERGIKVERCKDLSRLAQLMWGQRWMAAHIKMWKEGILEGSSLPQDFDTEPDYIRELFMKCWRNPELKEKKE
jgi:hypothetical protein